MNQLIKKIHKIVVNVGIGKLAVSTQGFEEKLLPVLMRDLALITGQKPSIRKIRQSISGFKVREGSVVGLKVTLRGKRMADFLTRLNNVVLPRLRDFRGIDLKNIDKNGNLSIGLREHVVFPEINQEMVKTNFGLQITIVPMVGSRSEAVDLYRAIGVPLQKV